MRFLQLSLLIVATGLQQALGGDVLSTNGYSKCLDTEAIKITRMHIEYDKATNMMNFDVGGISTRTQNVTAQLTVTAYGRQIDAKTFNPCEEGIRLLCPGKLIVDTLPGSTMY